MITRYNAGKRYSDIAVFQNVAYLAGQVPENSLDGDIRAQTTDVLAQIDQLLAMAGTDKSKILRCQIFLADLADVNGMNAVWDAWVAPGNAPPRATVQAAMVDPKYRIEIVITAAITA